MACTTHPLPAAPTQSRTMTRCECAGVSFADLARRLREDGLSPDEACRRTGCGQTCTACLPDLKQYLAVTSPPR
jgi:NAD(P)H-nitrite reductase large subunit